MAINRLSLLIQSRWSVQKGLSAADVDSLVHSLSIAPDNHEFHTHNCIHCNELSTHVYLK